VRPNCSGAGLFSGPPNDRGCRPSFPTVVGCASHADCSALAGAAAAGDTDTDQSSATLQPVVSVRTIEDKRRMEPKWPSGMGITIPQAAGTRNPTKDIRRSTYNARSVVSEAIPARFLP